MNQDSHSHTPSDFDQTAGSPSQPEPAAPQAWQTVDFPNAISADAIQRQALYIQETMQPNSSDGQHQDQQSFTTHDLDQLNHAGLIQLIQELNQSNHILMNRVAQLEQALDESEQTLQAELARSLAVSPGVMAAETGPENSDQINYLLNQLEFAQQTHQRQEILIETLRNQLQTSQERVNQLEKDYALTQQRHHQHLNQLRAAEDLCQDLHVRLHRQQEYTLQFKTALEKCLEVPPPSYEPGRSVNSESDSGNASDHISDSVFDLHSESSDSSSNAYDVWADLNHHSVPSVMPQSFLPKIQQIKPWSAQANNAEATPFTSAADESGVNARPSLASDPLQVDGALHDTSPDTDSETFTSSSTSVTDSLFSQSHAQSRFAATLAELARTPLEPIDDAVSTASEPAHPSSISADSQDQPTSMIDLPLSQQMDAALSSVEAINTDQSADRQTRQDHEAPLGTAHEPESGSGSGSGSGSMPNSSTSVASSQAIDINPDPGVAVHSPHDLEEDTPDDALWKNLAQLIDVSTDDILKAHVAQDFEAFEETAATHESHSFSQTNSEPVADSPPQHSSQQASVQPSAQPVEEPIPDVAWPSPLIYPTRPAKKRASLAAVDLPSFPRRDS